MQYLLERRESVLKKLLAPNARSVAEVTKEERTCTVTLFNWRNSARAKGQLMPDSDELADTWSSEEKFSIVLGSASMSETELGEHCRKRIAGECQSYWGNSIHMGCVSDKLGQDQYSLRLT